MPVRGGRKSLHTPGYDLILTLLREARVAAGLSQTELAARLRRPQNYVSKCELGERRVDVLEWLEFLAACESRPMTFLRRMRKA
ncbi:MAG: helix-turn-helix transcriptional regulator, partial [Rhodospirillales bacterium]|nr:helix-turn-helix transcriptional regulator [Acetobacter sp.]